MTTLKELQKKCNMVEKEIDDFVSSDYVCAFDERGDLHINFDDGDFIKFPLIKMRPYQHDVKIDLFVKKKLKHLYEWPRRGGKEVVSWNCLVEAALEKPGLYLMVYPTNVRARAILWEGSITMPDGVSLPFLEMIPPRLVKKFDNQQMKVYLVNGAIIWILGSDIDRGKLRGTNPLGAVFAEFAFQDPRVYQITIPIFRQNGGWFICQSTYDGMNHFYHLMKRNMNDPLWICREESTRTLLDENGQPYITDEMIDEDRRGGMPEYLIQQEYYGNVQINQETKFFARAMKNVYDNKRIERDLHVPGQNAYTFWDIGVNDLTAITIAQFRRVGNILWPVVIGYIEDNNRDLQSYIEEIRRFSALKRTPIRCHVAPHDGAKRDFYQGCKDIRMFGQELGEHFFVVSKPPSKQFGIEICRQLIERTYFDEEAQRLVDCLCSYEKEFDEELGVYKDRPVHDWSSHGVASFQTMALALQDGLINDQTYEVVYYQTEGL